MPWRRTRDPYKIWVSEVMLQQTTVVTVLPYYTMFLKRFPTPATLARAPEESVVAAWSGLGYYKRARDLHKAAKIIVNQYDGMVPDTMESLRRLPGLGEYTAAAVASIAFGEPVPVFDGNVRRVLSRLFVEGDDAKLKKIVGQLVPAGRPGDFNQSLMELGATVCRSKEPLCLFCPIRKTCRAFKAGAQKNWPPPRKRPPRIDINWVAAVIRKNGKVLFVQRPQGGRLGQMWELPMAEGPALSRAEGRTALEKKLGTRLSILSELPIVRHSITHHRIRVTPLVCRMMIPKRRAMDDPPHRWIPIDEPALSTSSLNRKILRHLLISSLPTTHLPSFVSLS